MLEVTKSNVFFTQVRIPLNVKINIVLIDGIDEFKQIILSFVHYKFTITLVFCLENLGTKPNSDAAVCTNYCLTLKLFQFLQIIWRGKRILTHCCFTYVPVIMKVV